LWVSMVIKNTKENACGQALPGGLTTYNAGEGKGKNKESKNKNNTKPAKRGEGGKKR